MNIKLVKLHKKYECLFTEMMDEWKSDIEQKHTNHSPWMIFRNDHHQFDYYLKNLEIKEETDGRVPDSTFFCLDCDRNIFVGAVNIRHYLNEFTYLTGGHIGDGIRPSERQKGYGTAMLALALKECEKLGLNKVLITCAEDNIGSEKCIRKNGGVLESIVEDEGEREKRFWITLHEEVVETKRLILKRQMPGDYLDMGAWTTDERVYKYLLNHASEKPEDALDWIRRKDPNSKEEYLMLLRRKEDNQALGIVGFFYIKETDTYNIAYNLRYDAWGNGYTSEAVCGMMSYLTQTRGAHRFEAECAKENIGSERVMQKAGMVYSHASSYSKRDGSVTFESKVYIKELE